MTMAAAMRHWLAELAGRIARMLGASRTISKPFSIVDVRRVVSEVLAK